MKPIFFILESNNNATYILNAKSVKDIVESLKFYKAQTSKQKLKKNLFTLYLMFLSLFSASKLKTKEEVLFYLNGLSNINMDFELGEESSVLISPTRDKIILHHHGKYFQKFAFGKSYENVKNESKIYDLLNVDLSHFEISKMYDKVETSDYCSFKLSAKRTYVNKELDLTLALVEFFSLSLQKDCLFDDFIDSLENELVQSTLTNAEATALLQSYKTKYKNQTIPLGLTHRDFKPWNVKMDDGLLIFDFEEAVLDGLALEDLFNYSVDPVIRYLDTKVVYEKIFQEVSVQEYKRYLKLLSIDIDFSVFLNLYLIQRAVFWQKAGEVDTANDYLNLFEYVNKKEVLDEN